jgi:hypothetical protein
MKNTLPKLYSLILFVLIVCCQTGCKTTGSVENVQNEATSIASNDDRSTEKTKFHFFRRQQEFIVAQIDNSGIDEEQLKIARQKLKEGWDFNVLGFFSFNASSDGIIYERKFLREENGSIKTGVDDDGDAFFTLAIVF